VKKPLEESDTDAPSKTKTYLVSHVVYFCVEWRRESAGDKEHATGTDEEDGNWR
jgi:hypothetical protein